MIGLTEVILGYLVAGAGVTLWILMGCEGRRGPQDRWWQTMIGVVLMIIFWLPLVVFVRRR